MHTLSRQSIMVSINNRLTSQRRMIEFSKKTTKRTEKGCITSKVTEGKKLLIKKTPSVLIFVFVFVSVPFRSPDQLSYGMPLLMISLIISSLLAIIQPGVMLCSSYCFKSGSTWCQLSGPKFNHLVKVWMPWYPYCKIIFPFVSSK